MPVDEDLAAVVDIVAAGRQALQFVDKMSLEEFRRDPKTSSAVILQVMIIGEAAKRLSPDFREAHPELPWSDIARMRDRLIHHYRRTDLRQVWRTVQSDLPPLLEALGPVAEAPEKDDGRGTADSPGTAEPTS